MNFKFMYNINLNFNIMNIQNFSKCCDNIEKSIKKSCNCFIDFINNPNTDLNKKNTTSEHTILHLLCYYNNFNFTKLFFDCVENRNVCVDINITNMFGNTPLHYFFLNSKIFSLDLLKLIISKGAAINQQNKFESTPLGVCHPTVVDKQSRNLCLEYMLNCGADPNICNDYGSNILTKFCDSNDYFAIEILVKSGTLSEKTVKDIRLDYVNKPGKYTAKTIEILEKWEEYSLFDIKEPSF